MEGGCGFGNGFNSARGRPVSDEVFKERERC